MTTPSPHPTDTYPPELCEWINHLPHPEASSTPHAARLARMLAILAAPDVMNESAHLFKGMLAGLDAGARQARIDNFKNFIEEAAALPERRHPTAGFKRIKHRFSEYRATHQNAAANGCIEAIEATHLLQYEYHAAREKHGTTEKRSPTNSNNEHIDAWRRWRLKRLALHYLGLEHPPLTDALFRALFTVSNDTAVQVPTAHHHPQDEPAA